MEDTENIKDVARKNETVIGESVHGMVVYIGFSMCEHHCYLLRRFGDGLSLRLVKLREKDDAAAMEDCAEYVPPDKAKSPLYNFDGNSGNITAPSRIGF